LLSVEPLPSFEIASHVLDTRRRVQGFGLRRITTPANRHLKRAQRVGRLRRTEPLHPGSRQQRTEVLAPE